LASLAGYLQQLAEKGISDLEDIAGKFETWLLEDKWMVLAHEREEWVKDAGKMEYLAVKCAKRGNDVYVSRVDSRLRGIGFNVPDVTHDFDRDPRTNILFVTLTYDTKLCPFDQAWKKIAVEFNRWKANIRKKFGDFAVFRCFEAFENGHPHIHAILIFKEMHFHVFRDWEMVNGETHEIWLIDEKEFFDGFWHSWTKIKAVYNLHGGLNYLTKYIMKCAEYNREDRKGKVTLALCWVFRKKAFYVSGEFRKALSDLIRSLCSSKTRKVQVNIFGNELEANKWNVLGFVNVFLLESIRVGFIPASTIRLKQEEMEEIFVRWEKLGLLQIG